MAVNDITILDTVGHPSIPTRVAQVTSGTTASIQPGTVVVLTTIGTSVFVAAGADGVPVIGTDWFAGIAKSASTETASAVGTVEVYIPIPGVIYRAAAKSATAANTAAKILALANKRSVFDLTAGVWTVDTAAADGSTSGLILTGTGDPTYNRVDFAVSVRCTPLGF